MQVFPFDIKDTFTPTKFKERNQNEKELFQGTWPVDRLTFESHTHMTRKQQRASEAIRRKGVWWRGFAALTCVAKGDPVCRLQCMMFFSTSFTDLTLNVSRIGTNLKMPGQRKIWIKVLYPSTIPLIDSSPWSSSSDFSCLNNPINVVATKNTTPQK